MEKSKWEGLPVPSDRNIYPSRHRAFQGWWEDIQFLFFFFPILPVLLGVGKGGETSGLEIFTCATQAPELGSLLTPALCQPPPLQPGTQGKGSRTELSCLHLSKIGKNTAKGAQGRPGNPGVPSGTVCPHPPPLGNFLSLPHTCLFAFLPFFTPPHFLGCSCSLLVPEVIFSSSSLKGSRVRVWFLQLPVAVLC